MTEDNTKETKQMNKYKIAMSCGKGSGIVKLLKRLILILLLSYLKHIETNDKESVGFLSVAVLMVLSVKMSF